MQVTNHRMTQTTLKEKYNNSQRNKLLKKRDERSFLQKKNCLSDQQKLK
jgi:hypothetical protein